LETETVLLRKHITTTRAELANGGAGGSQSGKPGATGKDDKAVDWKQLSNQFAEMQRGGDMRAMIRLQKRLMSMDAAELIAALDEIATLVIDNPLPQRKCLRSTAREAARPESRQG
jgi:hypothetical protein